MLTLVLLFNSLQYLYHNVNEIGIKILLYCQKYRSWTPAKVSVELKKLQLCTYTKYVLLIRNHNIQPCRINNSNAANLNYAIAYFSNKLIVLDHRSDFFKSYLRGASTNCIPWQLLCCFTLYLHLPNYVPNGYRKFANNSTLKLPIYIEKKVIFEPKPATLRDDVYV